MKPLTQALLFIIVFHSATAAPLANKNRKNENATHKEILQSIFQKQSSTSSKTTAQQKRLIGS